MPEARGEYIQSGEVHPTSSCGSSSSPLAQRSPCDLPLEKSPFDAWITMDISSPSHYCFGRLCSSYLGLDLRHFSPMHTLASFALLILAFLASYIAAHRLLHPRSWLTMRVTLAVLFSAAYVAFVTQLSPWHPYWIRELSVMCAMMFAWKSLELALMRRRESLAPLPRFLLHDALVLRPDVISDPAVLRAREAAARRPLGQRIVAALPSLGWSVVQYFCVEALNAFLMHQTGDVERMPLAWRFLLGCTFATCLWLHLSYFFGCMCALNIVVFSDAVEAWPSPFNKPYAATSPSDFWNTRWHAMFRWYFIQMVYRPVQSLVFRLYPKPGPVLKALPTLCVFVASGLFHEVLLYINHGRVTGEQLAFFVVHALVLMIQRALERAVGVAPPISSSSSYSSLSSSAIGANGHANGNGTAAAVAAAKTAEAGSGEQDAGTAASVVKGDGHGSDASERKDGDGSVTGPGQGRATGVTADQAAGGARKRREGRGEHGSDGKAGENGQQESGQEADVGKGSTVAVVGPGSGHRHVRPAPASSLLRAVALTLGMGQDKEVKFSVLAARWLVFNVFMGFTLILFFAPWFRFGYHRELRVFVPGPIWYLVTWTLDRLTGRG